jgi:sorting nexin-8
VQEEFTGKPLPPDLEDSLPKTLPDMFDTVRSGVRRSAESYINLCNMMERLTRRNEGIAAEYHRFSTALSSLTECSTDTYAVDTNDVPLLNEGLNSTARHLDQSRQLLEDEARAWEEGVLEDLKRQRDTLVSVRDMFDRRDKYAKDNIPSLEKRIANNETKLQNIRNKPAEQIKPGEAEKVEDAISKVRYTANLIPTQLTHALQDKESIVQQHARGVFIKECVRDELLYFQKSQYYISRLHQEWSQERVKYAELQADNWRALSEEVDSMPSAD